jgi:hypothetical protein
MRYALLLSTMLVVPGLAFATSTTATPADTSASTDPTATSTDPTATSTDPSATSSTTADASSSQITPQTSLSSAVGSSQRDSWGSFKVGDVSYDATVVDPPGNNTNPYELLFATGADGKTTPYIFELPPGGNGTVPPVSSNDLPATPAGGSGSGGTSGSGAPTGGTDVSTGGVGNNNNIIRIGGKDYQVIPVGNNTGTGSGNGSTTPTLTQLKDQLVKQQRDLARTTDKILTQINNQLPASTTPSSSTPSSSSSTTIAAK